MSGARYSRSRDPEGSEAPLFFLIAICALGLGLHAAPALAEAPPYVAAEALPGGAATAAVSDPAAAFSRPVGNLPAAARKRFRDGADLFYRRWIAGPAPPPALTGLGPRYNALSCQQCHRNDGRGRPPLETGARVRSFVLKIEPPHPEYGGQLRDRAVAGRIADGQAGVSWSPVYHGLGGGHVAKLWRPEWTVVAGRHGPVPPGRLSGRIAPPAFGVGLVEAIPAAAVAEAADPDDLDKDGISGRLPPGRFGWRGEAATVAEQAARAFAEDMGVTSRLAPGPDGAAEAPREVFDALVFYMRNLGPPAPEGPPSPAVLRGRAVFHASGCAACHRPQWRAGAAADPWLAGQTIWPYSDFLLHDMGPGLADGASPEWRTPPLWGLGRTRAVAGDAFYLHDGRARSVLEAILWHGGEAAPARDAVKAASPAARADLLAFLAWL